MSGAPTEPPKGPLSGKKALVTGASGGVGLLAARALAQTGAGLVLNAKNLSSLNAVADKLGGEFNIEVEVEASNPANAVDAEVLAMTAADANVFVSCSGNLPRGRLGAVREADWRKSWEAAVYAPINVVREMWAHMCDTPGALIILVIDASMTPELDDACASVAGGALMALVEALGKGRKEDTGQPCIVGLVTGRTAQGADVATAISMLAVEPEGWVSGTLLTPQAVIARVDGAKP